MNTILVVDDDPQIRSVLTEYLTYHGYRVLLAEDGDQALEEAKAHKHELDLVICDIFMPHREGLSTMAEIGHIIPGIKILVMSGGRVGEEAVLMLELGKRFGAIAGIQKPFELESLKKQIENLLQSTDGHCSSHQV